jgi:hypothetical protein
VLYVSVCAVTSDSTRSGALPYMASRPAPHAITVGLTPVAPYHSTVDVLCPAGMVSNEPSRPTCTDGPNCTSDVPMNWDAGDSMAACEPGCAPNSTMGPAPRPDVMDDLGSHVPYVGPCEPPSMNAPCHCAKPTEPSPSMAKAGKLVDRLPDEPPPVVTSASAVCVNSSAGTSAYVRNAVASSGAPAADHVSVVSLKAPHASAPAVTTGAPGDSVAHAPDTCTPGGPALRSVVQPATSTVYEPSPATATDSGLAASAVDAAAAASAAARASVCAMTGLK